MIIGRFSKAGGCRWLGCLATATTGKDKQVAGSPAYLPTQWRVVRGYSNRVRVERCWVEAVMDIHALRAMGCRKDVRKNADVREVQVGCDGRG